MFVDNNYVEDGITSKEYCMASRIIDLRGRKFGRLTVVSYAGKRAAAHCWNCECACGSESVVRGGNLVSGGATSCGCLQRELASKRFATHRRTKTTEYNIWSGMLSRCTNRNSRSYRYYGARGITVCDRWQSFENFFADMGARPSMKHTLDRIDNDGQYSPENCRWATLSEQARKKSNSVLVTHDGSTKTIAEWSEIVGIPYGTLHNRIVYLKWTPDKAINTPARVDPADLLLPIS